MELAREIAAAFAFAICFAMAFWLAATPVLVAAMWAIHIIFPSPDTTDTGPR